MERLNSVAALWAEHSLVRGGGESALLGAETSKAIRATHRKLTGRGEAVVSCPSSSPARDTVQPSLVPVWVEGADVGQGGVEEEGCGGRAAGQSGAYDFRPARGIGRQEGAISPQLASEATSVLQRKREENA